MAKRFVVKKRKMNPNTSLRAFEDKQAAFIERYKVRVERAKKIVSQGYELSAGDHMRLYENKDFISLAVDVDLWTQFVSTRCQEKKPNEVLEELIKKSLEEA
jgi:hypothetical protein